MNLWKNNGRRNAPDRDAELGQYIRLRREHLAAIPADHWRGILGWTIEQLKKEEA